MIESLQLCVILVHEPMTRFSQQWKEVCKMPVKYSIDTKIVVHYKKKGS